ncbi:hypothetical protein C922_05629 [Plasmodium inui San Antonio 1]|uniref:Uncharacterized protein n=1 Tax=Plasmodium inui San Antonio 1 TaxID=1237626 RepID=W6ZSU1_9APIC|nr:hypothetical protein C922_05629 [Plasmodium inui San Antonio 1]EUD63992.1 hypothetical protein C922_05629 [Plasmodium inui San Antonio 1]
MEELKLRDQSSSYNSRTARQGPQGCDEDANLYCYRSLKQHSVAVKGFLGRLGKILTNQYQGPKWAEITRTPQAVYRKVQTKEAESISWKPILDCIVDKILRLPSLSIKTEGRNKEVWKQANWEKLIKDGTGAYWGGTAKLQNFISAVMCIVGAILTEKDKTNPKNEQLRSRCGQVYESVKIDLEIIEEGISETSIRSHQEFLEKIREVEKSEETKLDGLGFLLAVAYGVSTCCDYSRGLTLGRLINKGKWTLGSLSPCYFDGSTLNCGGGDKSKEDKKVNIWAQGDQLLAKAQNREAAAALTLKAGPSGEHLKVLKSSYQAPDSSRLHSQSKGGSSAIGQRKDLDNNNKQAEKGLNEEKPKVESSTETRRLQGDSDAATPQPNLTGQAASAGTQGGLTGDQEGSLPPTGNEQPQLTGGDAAVSASSKDHSKQESETNESGGKGAETTVTDSGLPGMEAGLKEEDTNNSIGLGVGVTLGVLLGVMSIYGLWRVMFRAPRKARGGLIAGTRRWGVGYSRG